MSRAQRLLTLLQLLRNHRFPVVGEQLAKQLGVSLRTLYRDIDALREQGARIDGDPGVGYVLRPGFLLPPLMFSEEEIEAMVLGARWVGERGDGTLQIAANNALNKVAAVLPDKLRSTLDCATLLVGDEATLPATLQPDKSENNETLKTVDADLSPLREAIRNERKICILYRDNNAVPTTRIVWPFALGYYEHVRLLSAWCEMRNSFRCFRTDRLMLVSTMEDRYPRYRQALLKEWRERGGMSQLMTQVEEAC